MQRGFQRTQDQGRLIPALMDATERVTNWTWEGARPRGHGSGVCRALWLNNRAQMRGQAGPTALSPEVSSSFSPKPPAQLQ